MLNLLNKKGQRRNEGDLKKRRDLKRRSKSDIIDKKPKTTHSFPKPHVKVPIR